MPKTVLIVEDNELNMKLFNDLVETRGHRIVQTRSGIEAVDWRASTGPISFSWIFSCPRFRVSK